MHKKNFVAAIRVNGKILRESSDRVELPFGSEYSVLLKNLDTVRVQAQISIDGQDASGWLVIEPGQGLDVERFYRENRDQGNRFKFIERTERIENHRGVGAEDGLVRIEFKREKVYEAPKIVEHHTYHHHSWPYVYPRPCFPYIGPTWVYNSLGDNGGILTANAQNTSQSSLASQSSRFITKSASLQSKASAYCGPSGQSVQLNAIHEQAMQCAVQNQNDAGITVDGSLSSQRFIPVAGFECEASEVIVLHLVGKRGVAPVKVAKTVDQKPTCVTCGKTNKGTAKFCVECGTSLEKV